jgi:hypothetical protein
LVGVVAIFVTWLRTVDLVNRSGDSDSNHPGKKDEY